MKGINCVRGVYSSVTEDKSGCQNSSSWLWKRREGWDELMEREVWFYTLSLKLGDMLEGTDKLSV